MRQSAKKSKVIMTTELKFQSRYIGKGGPFLGIGWENNLRCSPSGQDFPGKVFNSPNLNAQGIPSQKRSLFQGNTTLMIERILKHR